ncbi:MAG: hypothetical protein QHH07_10415 [Sedimentisphaerales bacterium]|jgi:hypothetical protein|nr:hypothetical protein [Sedimentisphaerales bacterium]
MVVLSGQKVQPDGSSSSDLDGNRLEYAWRQVLGPLVVLSGADNVRPSFVAPEVDQEVVLVFELVVSDGSRKVSVHPACESGESEPRRVTVAVKLKVSG